MTEPDATYTGGAAEPLRNQAETSTADADGTREQLTGGDTLTGAPQSDYPGETYEPPDRPPKIDVPTPAEELLGDSLDERLAQEEPDAIADQDHKEPGIEDSPEDW